MRIGRVPDWDDDSITDEEYVKYLFYKQARGHCERCGTELDFDRRGPEYYGLEGCWEIHHRIGKRRLQKTFGSTLNPHLPIYLHVLCENCHKITKQDPDTLIEYC